MATIEIKYGMGDVVYHADSCFSEQQKECPDCLGTLKWTVKFATGEEVECPCKTCERGWGGSTGFVAWSEYTAEVRELTIGQVGFEGGQGRYMCKETGIGSGRTYNDSDLFATSEEAEIDAHNKCEEQLKSQARNNFKGKYEFADELGGFGYSRASALEENAKMNRWKEIIKDA